jgi:large subunit ribosomal protein L22
MEARATAKSVRISPRKTRLIVNLIRGKKIGDAAAILKNQNQKAARVIEKVLVSATANAENNLGLKKEALFVKETFVNEGPTLKRVHMGSRSHVDRRDHKTSHVIVVVEEKK